MARHKSHKIRDTPSAAPSSDGLRRSQMRDSFLNRSRLLARRFVRDFLDSHRFDLFRDTLLNLATEDLRREKHHLENNFQDKIYRRTDGSKALADWREVHTPQMQKQGVPPRVRHEFKAPRRTLVCERRRTRRAVIFALRKAGKGGRKNRPARWTDKSHVVCRKGR